MLAVGSQELFEPVNGITALPRPGGITADNLGPDLLNATAQQPVGAAERLGGSNETTAAPSTGSDVINRTLAAPAVTPGTAVTPAAPQTAVPGPAAGQPAAAPAAGPQAPVIRPPEPTNTAGAGPYPDLFDQPITPLLNEVGQEDTVQGQLQNLLATNNPLMVKAREDAKRMAAGRGLQNSSIAAQAGEQALFASALPVAQQDAATNAQMTMANTQAQNAFAQSQQQFAQNMELAKQQFGFNSSLSAQDAYQQLQQLAAAGDQEARMALLNFGYQRDLTVLQGEIARDQANLDFANRLTELATQGDIQSRLQLEQFGFNTELTAQENLARLQQLAAQGDINASLQLQQFQFQSLLNDQQNGFTLTLEDERFQNSQNLLMLEFEQRGVLSGQEAQQQLAFLNQQHMNTLAELDARVAAQNTAEAAAAGRAMQQNYLVAVADRQRQTSQEIAQIYQTEGLTQAQQNAAVQNAYNRLQTDLGMLRTYYQQSPLWDPNFGGGAPGPAGTLPPGPSGGPPSTAGQTPIIPDLNGLPLSGMFDEVRDVIRNRGLYP